MLRGQYKDLNVGSERIILKHMSKVYAEDYKTTNTIIRKKYEKKKENWVLKQQFSIKNLMNNFRYSKLVFQITNYLTKTLIKDKTKKIKNGVIIKEDLPIPKKIINIIITQSCHVNAYSTNINRNV